MKRTVTYIAIIGVYALGWQKSFAQAQELEELALDIEKLAQYKQILADLKKGYEILTKGYNTIKDVSKGQFELHKLFLDGLLEVSPAVRKYKRVADIIDFQLRINSEYKSAYSQFRRGGWFSTGELSYISSVYGNLVNLSLKNLDDLASILTAKRLRMNDEERLAGIDKIYLDMLDKLLFLRNFNSSTTILSLQRAREQQGTKVLEMFYNLK